MKLPDYWADEYVWEGPTREQLLRPHPEYEWFRPFARALDTKVIDGQRHSQLGRHTGGPVSL